VKHGRPLHYSGFTLMELLIAVAVFAVLGVMAYGGLNAVLTTQSHTEAEATRLQTLQLAIRFLERDILQFVARPIRDQFGDEQPALRLEDETALVFTRAGWRNPAHLTRSHFQRVAYLLEGGALIRRTWPVLDGLENDSALNFTLLPEVVDWKVRVLDSKGGWHESWPPPGGGLDTRSGSAIPAAVECTLTLEHWGEVRRLFAVTG